jgi:hypothetical protein
MKAGILGQRNLLKGGMHHPSRPRDTVVTSLKDVIKKSSSTGGIDVVDAQQQVDIGT